MSLSRVDLKTGKVTVLGDAEREKLRPPLKLCARLEGELKDFPRDTLFLDGMSIH